MGRDGLRSRAGGATEADGGSDGTISMVVVKQMAADGRVAMVVGDIAYDFTDFINAHPGGAEYLKKNTGKVATEEFVASHPIDIIERTLTSAEFKTMVLGPVDKATIQPDDIAKADASAHDSAALLPVGDRPTIDSCINIYDFEAIASRVCPPQGWVYYSSGADDEITLRENHNAFHRIWMRPRVMVNVKEIDMSTTILGHKCEMPMFLSAVAMCKLGHPEGETAWMKGAEREGIIYMVPTLSGCSFDDIVAARNDQSYPMFYQLYVNQDREEKCKKLVQKAELAGCSALFITCDAPQLGNRERDRRVKVTHAGAAAQKGNTGGSAQGTSKALTTFIDPSLNWDDLKWFKSITKMKIVLKGVGTAEDAIKALEHGVAGVLLSNHGGRQLDFARSAIEVLPEVMVALKAHKDYNPAKFEVFIDGGIRRGSDIYKALALGAKAVGVGRPALYAMTAFGADGVQKMIQILKKELQMTMQLMGTPNLAAITPAGVITDDLNRHIATVPADMLQKETYISPVTQAFMNKFDRAGTAIDGAAATAVVAAGGSGAQSPMSALQSETWKSLTATILTVDPKTSLHRTAVVMIVFLVMHVYGYLLFFQGAEAMNEWGKYLTTGTVGKASAAVELYALAATVAHMVSASYNTIKLNKLKPSKKDPIYMYPLGQAKLALTGSVIAYFLYLHISEFRLGHFGQDANGTDDLYQKCVQVAADPTAVATYLFSIFLMGVHMWAGWAKTVHKFEATAEQRKEFTSIGQAVVGAVTAGYAAVVVAAHLQGK